MPHTRDFSDALFRRAIILKFNNKFEGSEQQDTELKEKLAQELPGILNFALLGARRLFTNNGFTACPSSDAAKLEWRKEADQTAQFIDDECIIQADAMLLSADIYDRYKYWAAQNGIKRTLGRNSFTKRLRRHGVHPYKGEQGSRYLVGAILRPMQGIGRM